jgi:hypothetical protein
MSSIYSICIYDILHLLKEYLNSSNSSSNGEFLNFLKVNKTLASLYREFVIYRLNTRHSLKFIQEKDFYQLVTSRVLSTKRQIDLDLSNVDLGLTKMWDAFSCFQSLHHIDLHKAKQLPPLSCFSTAFSLDLSYNLDISDVSPLASVTQLNLSYCPRIIDVSPLRNCQKLYLKSCPAVMDVNTLGEVEELNLCYCHQLADDSIRELGKRNKILDLSFCSGITIINHLINVQYLNINFCRNIVGLSYVKDKFFFISAVKCPDN